MGIFLLNLIRTCLLFQHSTAQFNIQRQRWLPTTKTTSTIAEASTTTSTSESAGESGRGLANSRFLFPEKKSSLIVFSTCGDGDARRRRRNAFRRKDGARDSPVDSARDAAGDSAIEWEMKEEEEKEEEQEGACLEGEVDYDALFERFGIRQKLLSEEDPVKIYIYATVTMVGRKRKKRRLMEETDSNEAESPFENVFRTSIGPSKIAKTEEEPNKAQDPSSIDGDFSRGEKVLRKGSGEEGDSSSVDGQVMNGAAVVGKGVTNEKVGSGEEVEPNESGERRNSLTTKQSKRKDDDDDDESDPSNLRYHDSKAPTFASSGASPRGVHPFAAKALLTSIAATVAQSPFPGDCDGGGGGITTGLLTMTLFASFPGAKCFVTVDEGKAEGGDDGERLDDVADDEEGEDLDEMEIVRVTNEFLVTTIWRKWGGTVIGPSVGPDACRILLPWSTNGKESVEFSCFVSPFLVGGERPEKLRSLHFAFYFIDASWSKDNLDSVDFDVRFHLNAGDALEEAFEHAHIPVSHPPITASFSVFEPQRQTSMNRHKRSKQSEMSSNSTNPVSDWDFLSLADQINDHLVVENHEMNAVSLPPELYAGPEAYDDAAGRGRVDLGADGDGADSGETRQGGGRSDEKDGDNEEKEGRPSESGAGSPVGDVGIFGGDLNDLEEQESRGANPRRPRSKNRDCSDDQNVTRNGGGGGGVEGNGTDAKGRMEEGGRGSEPDAPASGDEEVEGKDEEPPKSGVKTIVLVTVGSICLVAVIVVTVVTVVRLRRMRKKKRNSDRPYDIADDNHAPHYVNTNNGIIDNISGLPSDYVA